MGKDLRGWQDAHLPVQAPNPQAQVPDDNPARRRTRRRVLITIDLLFVATGVLLWFFDLLPPPLPRRHAAVAAAEPIAVPTLPPVLPAAPRAPERPAAPPRKHLTPDEVMHLRAALSIANGELEKIDATLADNKATLERCRRAAAALAATPRVQGDEIAYSKAADNITATAANAQTSIDHETPLRAHYEKQREDSQARLDEDAAP